MAKPSSPSDKLPSQRQLRVGEILRHALVAVFLQENFFDPRLEGISITVSEVRVSPDLKQAKIFVYPLAGKAPENFIALITESVPQIQRHIAKRVQLRYVPKLTFVWDKSFDYVATIERLLHKSKPEGQDQ